MIDYTSIVASFYSGSSLSFSPSALKSALLKRTIDILISTFVYWIVLSLNQNLKAKQDMITIPAGTAFQLSVPIFALQNPVDNETTTVSISVNGTKFTDLEETFTGTHVFHNYPVGLYLKCDKAVYFTGNIEYPLVGDATITVTAPAHGQIKVVDYRTKQPVTSVPKGTQVECIWFDTTSKWRFVKWTIGGVDYTDERPVVVLTADTTIAVDITELPR